MMYFRMNYNINLVQNVSYTNYCIGQNQSQSQILKELILKSIIQYSISQQNQMQNKKILVQIVQKVKSDISDEDLQYSLQSDDQNISDSLFRLNLYGGLSFEEIHQVADNIVEYLGQNTQFDQWIGQAFRSTWVKIILISQFNLQKNFTTVLANDQQLDPIKLKQYIIALATTLNIDQLKNSQANVQKFVEQIQQNKVWKKLNCIYAEVHYDKEKNTEMLERSPNSVSSSVNNNKMKNEEEKLKKLKQQQQKTNQKLTNQIEKIKNQFNQNGMERQGNMSRRDDQSSEKSSQKDMKGQDNMSRRDDQSSEKSSQKDMKGQDNMSRTSDQSSKKSSQKDMKGQDNMSRTSDQSSKKSSQKDMKGQDNMNMSRRDDKFSKKSNQNPKYFASIKNPPIAQQQQSNISNQFNYHPNSDQYTHQNTQQFQNPYNSPKCEQNYHIDSQFQKPRTNAIPNNQNKQKLYQKQANRSPPPTRKDILQVLDQQEKKANMEKLQSQMNGLALAKGSIVDQLFQENLVEAFKSQFQRTGNYADSDYRMFKQKISKIASQMKIDSYDFKSELASPISPNQGYYNKILNIRNKLHPVYIPDLLHLLNKNRQARNVVQGKDIVVVLGISGAGKSTLIQMMLRYQLQKKLSSNQMTTLVPKGGLKPKHKQFVAKASSKSITKYVSAIQWDLPHSYTHQGHIFLADTPGFFDSQGLIVDASNSLSTIKTLGTANSIRVILLVNSRNWGTRGEGFKKLAKTLSKLFTKYHQRRVLYFLNCFSEQQLEQLPMKMAQMRDNLNAQQKGDNKFYAVINHFCSLLQKAKEKATKRKISINEAIKDIEQLVIMTPLQNDQSHQQEILQKVLQQDRRIENPSKVLDNVISPQVKTALQNQVNVLGDIALSCISKQNMGAAKYYIDLIAKLQQQTRQVNDIGQAQVKLYNIKQKLQNEYDNLLKNFEKMMQNKVLNLKNTQQDIKQLKQDQKNLQKLKNYYKNIQILSSIDKSQYIQSLIKQTSEKLQSKFESQFSKQLIQTVKFYSKYFDQKLQKKFVKSVQQKLNKLSEDIKQNIENENYQNLQQSIKEEKKILTQVSIIEGIRVQPGNWKNSLQKKISQRQSKCLNIVNKNKQQIQRLKQKDIDTLKQTLAKFQSVGQYSNEQQVRNIYLSFKRIKQGAVSLTRGYIRKIKQIIKKSINDTISSSIIQELTKCKDNIQLIMSQIQAVKEQIYQEFQFQLTNIVALVNNKTASIHEQMTKIEQEDWSAVKSIHYSIKMLRVLSNMCEQQQKMQCLQTITDVQQALKFQLQNFLNIVQAGIYSFETPPAEIKRILKANKINFSETKAKMSQEQQQQDQIKNICVSIKQTVNQKINTVLQQIKPFIGQHMQIQTQYFSAVQKDIYKMAKIKKFFDELKSQNYNSSNVADIKSKFQWSLKTLIDEISKQILAILSNFEQEIQQNKTIKKQDVYLVNKLREIVLKFRNNQDLSTIILQNYEDIFSELQIQTGRSLQNLKNMIQQKFQQNLKQEATIKNCFQILLKFQALKYLDGVQNSNKIIFQAILKDLKAQMNQKIKQNGYDVNFGQVLRVGNIDYYNFQKLYEFFKNSPEQNYKYVNLMTTLKFVLKQQDKIIHNSILNKNYSRSSNISENQIQNMFSIINKYLDTIKRVNQIVSEQQRIQIVGQTMKKITIIAVKIIESNESKIKKKIEQGGTGYAQAQALIQRIGYFSNLFSQFKIIEYLQFMDAKQQSLGGKNIEQYYHGIIRQKRKQINQKYIKSQQIILDNNFIADYASFDKEQLNKVEQRLIEQFKKQIKNVNELNKSDNEKILKSKIIQIGDKSKFLPAALRDTINNCIKTQMGNVFEQRAQQLKQARQSFKFNQLFQLFKTQQRPYLIKTYEQLAKNQFKKVSQILNQSQQNSEKIIAIIDEVIVNNFNKKDIEGNPKFKQFYEKQIVQINKMIKIYIRKLLKKLKNQLCSKFVQNKQQSALQANVNNTQCIVSLIDYLAINKALLKYDETQDIAELQKISQSYLDQIIKTSQQITIQKINKNIKVLSLFNLEYSCIEQVVQVLNVQSTKNIYEKFKPQLQKIQQKIKVFYTQINTMVDKVTKAVIFSQSMKNNSDKERQKFFEELDQSLFTIQVFLKNNIKLDKYDFENILRTSSNKIQRDIQQGIGKSCECVDIGFNNPSAQFGKQINVCLNIIVSAVQKLTFIKIDKALKQSLIDRIQNGYRRCFNELKNQSTRIMQLKSEFNREIKEITKQNQVKAQTKRTSQQNQFKQRIRNLTNQFDTNIKAQSDPQKQKEVQLKFKAEKAQLQKQYKDKLNSENQKITQSQQAMRKNAQNKIKGILNNYSKWLTIIYKANLQISHKQQQYKYQLDIYLKNDVTTYGKRILNQIYDTLKASNNNYANYLINSHEAFKSNQALKWEAKVKGKDINYVLANLNIQQSKKQGLKDLFESYQNQFNNWTKKYQQRPGDHIIEQLLQKVRIQSNNLKNFYHHGGNVSLAHPEILLALIYALWTISNSQIDDEIVIFYYQPHPAQVVAIFLCLSFLRQDNTKALNSKMAQIKTGQGKSVVLAGLSSYLALCDFEVNSVCYSMYLSSRDRQAFKPLFEKLQIDHKISYGTFNTVCEQLLNKQTKQSKGFRAQIQKMLQQQKPGWFQKIISKIASFFKNLLPNANQTSKSKKIMLIDEVDVFFDPSFFGSLYCPDVCLASTQISQLMKKVWQMYKAYPEIKDDKIQKTGQFSNVLQKYSKLKKLMREQIKGMILGCRGVQHDYVVRDDLIQYKDQDGISSKISYGFQTLFAYLRELDKNSITSGSVERALKISLIIAEFSYALLPTYFRSIIGVTGTYQNMSSHKKRFMQTEYNVKAAYAIPSVYGNDNRRKINSPKIVAPQQHYKEIVNQIKQVHATGRPVLVFFKSTAELAAFFNMKIYQDLQSKTTFLNQTHPASDRDLRITKACNKGNITLMTNSFGRGTDFVVFDESIFQIDHGGLHVIQTYLSTDASQQIQVQGRTARQGSPGTYTLLISIQDLQLLEMKPQSVANFTSQLNRARQYRQTKEWLQLVTRLNQSKGKHEKCIQIFQNQKISQKEIIEYIKNLNSYQEIRSRVCRTIVFCDATGSMSGVLKKLLNILGQMIKEIIEITSNYKSASSSLLQLGVYRNYNCTAQMLFQSTPFESQATNLLNFLKGVYADGGIGEEAIQMAYHHVNTTNDVDQVIIIGDAPSNNDADTNINRRSKGQHYWNSNNIPFYSSEKQLQQIINKKIPIHSFYINTQPQLGTKQYFVGVSTRTNGYCQQFNVDSRDASTRLAQFIAQRILRKTAADNKQADEMVTVYRKRHQL